MGGDLQSSLIVSGDNHVLNTHFRHLFDHPACMQEKPSSTAVGFLSASLPDRWRRHSESLPALPNAHGGGTGPAAPRARARPRGAEGCRNAGRRAPESPGAAARAGAAVAAAEPRRVEVQLPLCRPATCEHELRPRSVARSPRCQGEAWLRSRSAASDGRQEEAAPLQRAGPRLYEPPPARRLERQQAVALAALRRAARPRSPRGRRAAASLAEPRAGRRELLAGRRNRGASPTPLADLVLQSAGLPPSRRQLM
ncbi:unnamed protein product [Prorocentrum cordatum]|uniref:Uncharacterized protein n=1 Tax=Prorocentrum cordatum TaxID=2364126 RepID=A0ABN9S477_9DINO|nr:unnamed protein product [Polarella glacialis]